MLLNLSVAFIFAAPLLFGGVVNGQPLPDPKDGFVISYNTGECCGGTRRARGLCCSDQWQTVDAPTDVQVVPFCCGNSYAKYPKQLCCKDKVVENPNPTAINSGCCGEKPYDAFTHKCCGNTLTPFSADSQNLWCCGEAAYNPSNSSCCNGAVVPNAYGRGLCCDGKMIDPTVQLCCEGKVFPREKPESTCCGAAPMDGSRESCCAAKAKYTVGSSSVCCGKTLVSSPLQCCDDTPYDPTRELCCQFNTVIKVPGVSGVRLKGYGCCQSSYFNRMTSMCCNDAIVPIFAPCSCRNSASNQLNFCCGSASYNPNNAVCCSDGVLTKEKYNANCSLECKDFEIF